VIRDLVTKSRSYRRFRQDEGISREALTGLVELARLTPSAGNRQPLKYLFSWTREKNDVIFPCLTWAAYLKDWTGPDEGERPAGYVVILGDKEINETVQCDHGIVAQTMMLGAVEKGLGGCIIGAINRERMRDALRIPPRYEILLVLALGYPTETVVIEEMKDGDFRYWRDENSHHHVPKRSLTDLILEL
jgi:nitroreductase